ncbi:aspartate/glutamate racemase family protein [Dyadobacter sp. LJ53]|uniref:aspartate/glutamate racemase family protein n=1 Tax=Dyadobacter chenwenxiniae TaxID=2906456 RepID=UPI001F348986|nr:aspartate/glutamate racemase family protein [Dyadobacter chenwenxiniae]MCF0050628.1 aspartate/glutamate racemase family protein [Dyadobacter chenwenxiniae]
MKKIGLIGGMSWVSTIDYYRYINEGINHRLGGLHFAECIIYSVNFNDFVGNNVAGNWGETYKIIAEACEKLKSAGAECIVLCANTAHAVADRLEENLDLPLIHVITETANEIKKLGMSRVGLLGTKFTMEMDFYVDKMAAHGVEAIIPASQEAREFIQQTLKDELGKGIIKEETKRRYIAIIDKLINNGAEGIILGCTEIPLLLSQNDVSVPVFDTTKIHAQAAVDFALAR